MCQKKVKKIQIGGKWKDMTEGEAWWSGHLRWWDDGDDGDDDNDDDEEEGEGDDQEDEEEEEGVGARWWKVGRGCWRRNVAKETSGTRRDGLATWACQAPEGTINLQHSKVQTKILATKFP